MAHCRVTISKSQKGEATKLKQTFASVDLDELIYLKYIRLHCQFYYTTKHFITITSPIHYTTLHYIVLLYSAFITYINYIILHYITVCYITITLLYNGIGYKISKS